MTAAFLASTTPLFALTPNVSQCTIWRLFASQGHLGHTAAAAAVGGLAGYMVGLAVRSTADLTQLACAQAAFTIFLINLGVLKIDWGA